MESGRTPSVVERMALESPMLAELERSIVDQKANQGGTTQSDINIGVIQRIIAFIQASDQRMQC